MTGIRRWLEGLELGQYVETFEENNIDLDIALDLSDQDLKDLRVTSMGHRKRLLRADSGFSESTDNQAILTKGTRARKYSWACVEKIPERGAIATPLVRIGSVSRDRDLPSVDGIHHVEHLARVREIGFRQDNRKSPLLESGNNLRKSSGQYRCHAFERFVEQ